ncbi:hypothetical protein [Natrialba taiwanensis]|nr:hypothetical protein [Natrialba taiwanensis]
MRRRTILLGAGTGAAITLSGCGLLRTRFEKSTADDAVGAPFLPDPNR